MTSTNEMTKDLAPRIAIDIYIDGEVRTSTVHRHLRRSNLVLLLLSLAGCIQVGLAVDSIVDGTEMLQTFGQAAVFIAFLFPAHEQWSQRQLLERILSSLDSDNESR